MSTMNGEQESDMRELTNLMDVVAAESGKTEVETETEAVVEITETVEVVAVETAVVETVVEEVVVETAVIEPKPARPQQSQRKQRPRRKSAVTSRDVKRWFASCGRCGFFLAAYQLLETKVDLETAVFNTKGDWLTLDWDYEIRNLVNKSYGSQLDTGIYHLDTGCPECRRRFIIQADDDERSFRIALNPAIKK